MTTPAAHLPNPSALKRVIRIDDDRPTPLIGYVLGYEDENRAHIAWGDAAYSDNPWNEARIEYIDELTTAPPRSYQPRCPVCGGLNPGDITHTRC